MVETGEGYVLSQRERRFGASNLWEGVLEQEDGSRRRVLTLLLAFTILLCGCALVGSAMYRVHWRYTVRTFPHRVDIPSEGATLKVLWIGNSHSWSYGLVGEVQTRAETAGDGPVYVRWVESQTLPQVEHRLPGLLAEENWDVVLLQPQSVPANGDPPELFRRVNTAIQIVRRHNPDVRILLYENWRYTGERGASSAPQTHIDAVFCELANAHQAVDVAWVGKNFDARHISADGNHMSPAGAREAAEILHEALVTPPERWRKLMCAYSGIEYEMHGQFGDDPIVQATWDEYGYRRPNRYGVTQRLALLEDGTFQLGMFRIDGYMPFALGLSSDRVLSNAMWGDRAPPSRGPWVQLSERLPGKRPSVIKRAGSQRIGGVPVEVHAVSTPLSAVSLLLELKGDLWFIGDVLTHPCPPMAQTWEEAEAVGAWLREFGRAHPEATFHGTSGSRVEPGGLEAVADSLDAYAAVWKRGDEAEKEVVREAFSEFKECNPHWAFQGVPRP